MGKKQQLNATPDELWFTAPDNFGDDGHKHRQYELESDAFQAKQSTEYMVNLGFEIYTFTGKHGEGYEPKTETDFRGDDKMMMKLVREGVVNWIRDPAELERRKKTAGSRFAIRKGCAVTSPKGMLDEHTTIDETGADFAVPAEAEQQLADRNTGTVRTIPGHEGHDGRAVLLDLVKKGYIVDSSSKEPLPPHPHEHMRGKGF